MLLKAKYYHYEKSLKIDNTAQLSYSLQVDYYILLQPAGYFAGKQHCKIISRYLSKIGCIIQYNCSNEDTSNGTVNQLPQYNQYTLHKN